MGRMPIEQRAGGLVCRKINGQIKYLLVTSISNPARWIFPSGHIEEGEEFTDTALREVLEEAGVEAEIIGSLGTLRYVWFQEHQKVTIDNHLFLMKYLKTVDTKPEGRWVEFYSIDEILTLNLWNETKVFLKGIHDTINSLIKINE
jgi:8-oxo-dGTP pyrophosphatase MutT (NUDIX family)